VIDLVLVIRRDITARRLGARCAGGRRRDGAARNRPHSSALFLTTRAVAACTHRPYDRWAGHSCPPRRMSPRCRAWSLVDWPLTALL